MPRFSVVSGVFLDRDDTLIECDEITPDGDLGDPALVRLLPGVGEAVRLLSEAGFRLVVVTNQGGVARGRYTVRDVEAVHERLNALVGGRIDAFRSCPYHPEGTVAKFAREHPWRKPAPGMILDATAEFGIYLTRAGLVGDKGRDCAAGRAAGCRTILIDRPGRRAPEGGEDPGGDFTASDLGEAAKIIVSRQ